jgi:hypothetical protein
MSAEEKDQAKAWTCAAHIEYEKGKRSGILDDSEGYVLHEGDKIYWQNVYESLASGGQYVENTEK